MRKKLLTASLLIVAILFAKSALALTWEEKEDLRERTRIIEDEKRRMKMTPEERYKEDVNNFVHIFNVFTGGVNTSNGKKQNTKTKNQNANVKNQNKKTGTQATNSNRNMQDNTSSKQDFHIGAQTLTEKQINAHKNK